LWSNYHNWRSDRGVSEYRLLAYGCRSIQCASNKLSGGRKLNKLIVILTAALATNVAGCATVMNGTNTPYTTVTQPTGAAVKFTNGASCTTPCDLELRRKDDVRADVTLSGHKPTYVLIQSKLGGTAFGNLLLGGGVGAIVDGSNGASNKLYPRPLIIRLAPEGSEGGAVLLDEKGNVFKTVKAHNDSVRADVSKTVGPRLSGLEGGDPE